MSFYPNETDLTKGGLVSRSTLLPKKGEIKAIRLSTSLQSKKPKPSTIYEDLSPDFSIIQVRSSESSPLRIAFEPI